MAPLTGRVLSMLACIRIYMRIIYVCISTACSATHRAQGEALQHIPPQTVLKYIIFYLKKKENIVFFIKKIIQRLTLSEKYWNYSIFYVQIWISMIYARDRASEHAMHICKILHRQFFSLSLWCRLACEFTALHTPYISAPPRLTGALCYYLYI